MSGAELILRDPLGERPLAASDFPISIGGPGHTIVFGDLHTADAAAWIAWHDGQLFLQPAADGPPVLCNGAAVKRSTWLREGDVIDIARGRLRLGTTGGAPTLAIEDGSGGNLTLPPDAPLGGPGQRWQRRGRRRADRRRFSTPGRGPAGAPAHGATCGRRLRVRPARAGDMVPVHGTSGAHRYGAGGRRSAPAGRSAPVLHIGANHFALPGKYELVATRKGYHTLRTSVQVTDASGQSLRFSLRKLPGRLLVESDVPARIRRCGPRTRPCARRIQAASPVVMKCW